MPRYKRRPCLLDVETFCSRVDVIKNLVIYVRRNTIVVLTYSPGGRGYSHTLAIRVCAAQRGRDFEARDLERRIHFRGVF